MAEATEELVKAYLEQKGYLVTIGKRVDAKTHINSPRAEIDIVAVKNKSTNDSLPLRIAGEVKSFSVNDARGFEKLDKILRKKYGYSSREDYSRFKWVNNKEYRKDILSCLNKEYGFNDFQFVLFCSKITSKYEQEIKDFLREENIHLVTHDEIIKQLLESRKNEYTDSQILQVLRLLKKNFKNIKLD